VGGIPSLWLGEKAGSGTFGPMDAVIAPLLLVAFVLLGGLVACAGHRPSPARALSRRHGEHAGRPVALHTLSNALGLTAQVSEFGATLVSVRVPDCLGQIAEVTLGHDDFRGYVEQNPYLGSTVGRYANRIAGGNFTIDGQTFQVARNNNGQHLHGGVAGLDRRLWSSQSVREGDAAGVRLTYVSPAGEEDYPGTLTVHVTYLVPADRNEVRIRFEATTDAPTLCNLTNHAFFNLAGGGEILRHRLELFADRFIPISESLIATGERTPVEGTPFDFRRAHTIGERIDAAHPQLVRARGYDHAYDLGLGGALRLAARMTDPESGRTLEVLTDAPGLQFYSGNFLDGTVQGRWIKPYGFRQGFCLEPGLFPDSPNQPAFQRAGYPSGVLRPSEKYAMEMVYRFGVA
jgi:aldose 1-epimerase